MYRNFFGLHANPFNMNPDPRYLFLTPRMEEALACLFYGVESRKGFVLLTGEVGTGKTTLVNKLLDRLRERNVAAAFVFNPRMNVQQFLNYIATDFGITTETTSKNKKDKDEVLRDLNDWLLDRYRSGQTAVLIVDEAQNLSAKLLEEIRLLTNLETATDKLLQVVLVGQPELEQSLKQPNLRQLRQRITLWARTQPLTFDETKAYVAERLRIAGSNGEEIFDSSALHEIHRFSSGIPRVVNLICEHCLVAAFADQKKAISGDVVEVVAREFDLNDDGACLPSNVTTATRTYPSEEVELAKALETITAWLINYSKLTSLDHKVEATGRIQDTSNRSGPDVAEIAVAGARLDAPPKTLTAHVRCFSGKRRNGNPAEIRA
jgi:type II secretory pathway predicted ATPase ExeA